MTIFFSFRFYAGWLKAKFIILVFYDYDVFFYFAKNCHGNPASVSVFTDKPRILKEAPTPVLYGGQDCCIYSLASKSESEFYRN